MSDSQTIIQAIAQLVSMAIEYAGYRLAMFVMVIVFTTPLHFMIAYVVVNVALILFIISKWSTMLTNWISRGIWWVYALRAKEKSRA